MNPQLVMEEYLYSSNNSTEPPGLRQVHRRSRHDVSRKTGEDNIRWVK